MELTAGCLIAERYQLDRLIGEGGMGVVWSATHLLTRKVVALKFLKGASPEHTKRFLREARIAGMLGHPNIVAVHDVLQLPDDGTPMMVMELLHGESLEARLRRGAIPLGELATLMLPVVSAVGSAHTRGVVHRDLKPDNIFLARSPGGHPQTPGADVEVKVLDFGIAKLTATEGDAASTSGLTQTGAVMGTPYYMAPEQVFGEKNVDQRVDVWALGVILYECMSGRRPIEGDNFGQIFKNIAMGDIAPLESWVPGLPGDVNSLVGRMLSRDRSQRPEDLREVFAVLSRHAGVSVPTFGAPRPVGSSVPPPSQDERIVIGSGVDATTPTSLAAGTLSNAASIAKDSARPAAASRSWIAPAAAAVVIALGVGGWRVVTTRAAADASAARPASLRPADLAAVTSAATGAAVSAIADAVASSGASSTASPDHSGDTPRSPAASASATPRAQGNVVGPPAAHPQTAGPRPADKQLDKKKLPGGIHGDSPY